MYFDLRGMVRKEGKRGMDIKGVIGRLVNRG